MARVIIVILLLAVAGFCVFGFLATFEPMDAGAQLVWRVAYAAGGLVCLGAAVWLLFLRRTA